MGNERGTFQRNLRGVLWRFNKILELVREMFRKEDVLNDGLRGTRRRRDGDTNGELRRKDRADSLQPSALQSRFRGVLVRSKVFNPAL